MKNNDSTNIRKAREHKLHKAMPTDMLVIPKIAEANHEKLAQRPRRKRRVNYEKKIMNDPFIMNV